MSNETCPFCGSGLMTKTLEGHCSYHCGTAGELRSGRCQTICDKRENVRLKAIVREMGKATSELLSGHDQLYKAYFHYLPDCNPHNDLAAKDARELLIRPDVKAIVED